MIVAVAALRTELLFVRGCPRVRTGIGPGARERLARAFERIRPRAAVILGFCGATRAHLAPGALILATSLRRGKEELSVPEEIVAAAREGLPGAQAGPLATVDGMADAAEKARLSLDAVAVDLESFHLAATLRERGIPFLVLRCVLDPLWEDLSRRAKVLLAPRALACARRLARAMRTLAPVLVEVISRDA
ncbi:5'-methylthioadenosine/S-adenosylhomocysteine nucleosidase family protein [Candidatus Bipolaricaulota sp. J31]